MKLTPLDVENARFDRSLAGYAPKAVRAFLADVAEELEAARRELAEARDALEARDARIEELRSVERDLREAIVSAERVGEQVKANAEAEAALVRERADLARREAEADVARLRTMEGTIRERLRGMLQAFERSLDLDVGTDDGPADGDAAGSLRAEDLHDAGGEPDA
ncbi:MAG: DivIVA domain-containing protein [Trueperaceae bacterium]|nr:DivIVA domain-containing protein [Trueperaceae bacterium]